MNDAPSTVPQVRQSTSQPTQTCCISRIPPVNAYSLIVPISREFEIGFCRAAIPCARQRSPVGAQFIYFAIDETSDRLARAILGVDFEMDRPVLRIQFCIL